MQQQQTRTQAETAQQPAENQAERQQITVYKCSNCGTLHAADDKFCSECGMGLKGNTCVYCGAETKPNWEICPSCGHNLQAELCSFCGGKMTPDDAFCPECGNPRTGILCSHCNTLNFRSFCRKCNAPLNALAQEALEEARKDPVVQKAITIAHELEELEQILMATEEEEGTQPPELPQVTEENRELINQYKDLLAAFRGQKPEEKKEEPRTTPPIETPKPESKPKRNFSIKIVTKEEAMAKYKEKLSEMQNTINSMCPDAAMTPQLQRDYYTARKVEILTKTKMLSPLYWICNAYGCMHYNPNECAEPWRGGKWVYKEIEKTVSTWGYK